MNIGIDIGGTTTDICGLQDKKIIHPLTVRSDDPVTSAAGALGKFLESTGIPLSAIRQIAATGVGAGKVGPSLFGIPVKTINEFTAIGTAGSYLSGYRKAVVISMGTGTAIVTVDQEKISHWGGSGVGGGTLQGLAKSLLNISNINTLVDKALKGKLENVDLTVGDIAGGAMANLPENVTASNFGKMLDTATDEDVAMAIFNLVGQTIGVLGIAAARSSQTDDIILTGKLSGLTPIRKVVQGVSNLYHIHFIIPENADYATAIGAAIYQERNP